MTPQQQLFDLVVARLIEQGSASMSADGNMCLYRGPKGRKCAAGHVLPDAYVHLVAEGRSVTQPHNEPVFRSIVGAGNINLLRSLQAAHDFASKSPKVFSRLLLHELGEIAARFKLDPTAIRWSLIGRALS